MKHNFWIISGTDTTYGLVRSRPLTGITNHTTQSRRLNRFFASMPKVRRSCRVGANCWFNSSSFHQQFNSFNSYGHGSKASWSQPYYVLADLLDSHLYRMFDISTSLQAPLSARESTNEQEASELARCQQNLERAYQEKRALEMLVQQLRKQLLHVSCCFAMCFIVVIAGLGVLDKSPSNIKL